MAQKKGGLGKGLGALIQPGGFAQEKNDDSVKTVKISDVEPDKSQPRKRFDDDALKELADSIEDVGVIQPIIVKKDGGMYKIIAGERRWRAAKLAGLKEIPVVVKEFSEGEALRIALLENIQREDLNPIEEALAFQRLIDEYSMKHEELSRKISKSRAAVSNSLRLLKLDSRVQQMLIDEKISGGHARALLAIDNPDDQYELAVFIFDNDLSVRDTERKINAIKADAGGKKEKKEDKEAPVYRQLEERLKLSLGANVKINRKSSSKGKIEIEYSSIDEFERLYDKLQGNT